MNLLEASHHLTAILWQLLFGSPCSGGFGLLLPLTMHTWSSRPTHTQQAPSLCRRIIDVSRILGALISYLPTIRDVGIYIGLHCHQLDGDWCFNVPLWGNPVLLPNIMVEAGRSRQERTGEA